MDAPTSLLTDRYELTMVDVALVNGMASKRAVFEIFTRSLPAGRSYGIVGGTARALDAIVRFRFTDDELSWLEANGIVSDAGLAYLADYRFAGDAWGFREGDVYLQNSPVLTIEASFAEAVVLETVLLSVFNHDSAIASAMARMADAAGNRAIIEGGSRRVHEQAGVSAARSAYLAGATATSNLEAGRRFSVPTVGTIAHAFILAHGTERDAFEAQHQSLGCDTVFLVDTYDTAQGIRTAVEVAGPGIGGIRIDSGDLALEAKQARALLDELGASGARIIVSGDLDEWSILELAGAPIDAYLVGTNLITGSGHPTASMVYKLVAVEDDIGRLVSVAKTSLGKGTVGGRKAAFRLLDGDGHLDHDVLVPDNETAIGDIDGPGRRLQVPLIRSGEVVAQPSLDESRALSETSREELPLPARFPDPELTFETLVAGP
ncbi:MAG: nicotinate phosphoribosyltransferase [Acidimicrobiia bacterium]|nr:nicotinate phosphoribosyltransferase [Acidimicrobiia bacterium]